MQLNREQRWKQNRLGYFTASEIESLLPKKGGFDKGAMDLLYQKQWERNSPIPYFRKGNANFDFGHKYESYAIAWLRENQIELGLVGEIKHCSSDEDFPEDIVFVKTDYGLGGSPDAYLEKDGIIRSLIEIKCVEGKDWHRYCSPTLSIESKREMALNGIGNKTGHLNQLAAQLILYPEVDHIYLLKYRPQIEEDELDLANPLDPSRGVLFRFERSEFGILLDQLKEKVAFCDEYLKAGLDLEQIGSASAIKAENGEILTFEILEK